MEHELFEVHKLIVKLSENWNTLPVKVIIILTHEFVTAKMTLLSRD